MIPNFVGSRNPFHGVYPGAFGLPAGAISTRTPSPPSPLIPGLVRTRFIETSRFSYESRLVASTQTGRCFRPSHPRLGIKPSPASRRGETPQHRLAVCDPRPLAGEGSRVRAVLCSTQHNQGHTPKTGRASIKRPTRTQNERLKPLLGGSGNAGIRSPARSTGSDGRGVGGPSPTDGTSGPSLARRPGRNLPARPTPCDGNRSTR